jgi:hypothetical protein
LNTDRTSIADAAKAVYVDKTDVVEGMLGREYMFDIKEITASR